MLTNLPLFAISILALMGEIAKADITLKLTTHAEQTAPMPRTLGAGRSRPRRQDTASKSDIEARQANSGATFSMAHAPISLNNQDSRGVLYTVDIEIAGVSLPVLIDTGSSQFWVASQDCPDCIAIKKTGAPIPIPTDCGNTTMFYISGEVSGCMVTQDVIIGGYHLPAQKVVAARELRGALGTQPFPLSGIVGLGRGSEDGLFGLPPIRQLFDSNQIDSTTVGFYLNRDWQTGGTGELTFGDVTKSSHVDVSKSARLPSTDDLFGMYHVRMDSMKSGGSEVVGNRTVIIDTGSTNLMVPADFLPAIYRTLNTDRIERRQGDPYILPCTKEPRVNDLVLSFGGLDWPIDYQDMVGAEVEGRKGYCWGKIVATQGSANNLTWIGHVFLKNVYSAFDVSDGSVTFYGLK